MPAQTTRGPKALRAVLATIGFSALAGVLVAVMVAPAAAVAAATANNSISVFEGLPEYIKLGQQRQKNEIFVRTPEGSTSLVTTVFDQNREEVKLDEMSEPLQWAAVAGEDRRFYQHSGVDLPSVARAAIGTLTGEAGAGGASTLTMQTVRNILVLEAANDDQLTGEERQAAQEEALEYSAERKLKEIRLAVALEKEYTKDQILEGYLNIANFGRNTYGVETAAQQYFGTTAKEITIAQAASLIATVQQPSILNLGDPENWAANQVRRDFIIGAMLDQGYITQAEHDEAVGTPVDDNFVSIQNPTQGCLAAATPYRFFCDYVVKLVLRGQIPSVGDTPETAQAAWTRGGFKLIGTLDTGIQTTATEQVQANAPNTEDRFALGAAVSTVEAGTGRILAMAQNKDFDDSGEGGGPTTTAVNFNTDNAYGGSRGFQPGSTYKPFTLLAWLQDGRGVNEGFNVGKLDFSSTTFEDSCNGNHTGNVIRNDEGERGGYTVVRGTARSVNSVFYQMASQLDQCAIRDVANSLGVHNATGKADGSDMQTVPSCVLGGCENTIAPLTMAAAYAAIANQGVYCKPIAIDTVIGPDDAELPGQDADCHQAVEPDVANTAAYAMESVVTGGGTAGASNPGDGVPYIGKTGTTNEGVHTWMVGSSTKAASAVWVGNISGDQSLRNISVNGQTASVIRHAIFRPLAQYVDSRLGGDAFPGPAQNLLFGTPTNVPDVRGRTADEARPIIENAQLTFGGASEVDSEEPAGTIIRQEPGAGASVTKGTSVTVFVSTGRAPQVETPDVTGQGADAARSALQSAGFSNVSESCQAADPGQPEDPGNPDDPGDPGEGEDPGQGQADPEGLDRVVSQDPAAGTAVDPGGSATITVLRAQC